MRHCDVAVIGPGLMGSAALDALLRRGVDAVDFDPSGPGALEGASHGCCRVFAVASACSGHGAKFAPAIGERLAKLALDPAYQVESYFQLSRYSRFH
jgi:glycine/D-amino acid oxidase-like deaminating enzyme